ncbi:hypothetical protein [Ramlibacter tataouinensis]|nr:hypothetical protein [Ramlibacter tataouinensis]
MLAVCADPASAEGPSDRYWIQIEGFRPAIESTARFDVPRLPVQGTEVKFEDELGLSDSKSLPYFLMGLRLGERWRLEFEYYELNRQGSGTIHRDIRWGDLVFPASSNVASRFDSKIYRFSAGYSFLRNPTAELGAALGVHATDFAIALSGQGSGALGGTPLSGTFQSEENARVPLPTLGLYGSYLLSPDWMIRGRADYLSLDYGKYDGSLLNLMGAVTWRFSKNFGAGLGYRYVDYQLSGTKERFRGELSYRFRGPAIYLEAVL